MWSVVFALLPKRYLIGAGAAIAALVVCATAYGIHERSVKRSYFQKGYHFAVDSAREATIVRMMGQHARDSVHFDSAYKAVAPIIAQAATPRLRVDTVPLAVNCDSLPPLVSVYVESEHRSYPAHPALAKLLVWYDSTLYKVTVPALEAAHVKSAHDDSLIAVLRQQPDTVYVPRHNAIRHDVMLLIDGALLYRFGPKILAGLAHLHPHL